MQYHVLHCRIMRWYAFLFTNMYILLTFALIFHGIYVFLQSFLKE